MVLKKQDIWDRLKTKSTWITSDRTAILGSAVPEHHFRYIVAVWLPGNTQVNLTPMIEKYEEATSYETIFCPIPVAPTDFRQIPQGGYSLEDPITVLEGGARLYGKVDVTGHSLNVTVNYWESEVDV